MLWPDVIKIKEFYASRLGQMAGRLLKQRIRRFWPVTAGEHVVGMGFAVPYLTPFLDEARSVTALMPSSQGVIHWPQGKLNLTALTDEGELPLANESVTRMLLVHAMENTDQLRTMMNEIWRVLEPGGTVLAVVPNRRGIWARLETTPFGSGHPFSLSQLKKVFRDAQFTPTKHEHALFVPPNASRFALRSARPIEEIGGRFFPFLGGLIVMEGEKQIYAIRPKGKAAKARNKGFAPAAQPVVG